MVELAWLWLRHQPDSDLARWFHDRVGAARGRTRRGAMVAVARKLAVALWRYPTTGLVPEGARVAARANAGGPRQPGGMRDRPPTGHYHRDQDGAHPNRACNLPHAAPGAADTVGDRI